MHRVISHHIFSRSVTRKSPKTSSLLFRGVNSSWELSFRYEQCNRCSNTVRGNYNKLREDDVAFFRSCLDSSGIITDRDELMKYNVDWLKSIKGSSSIVLRPKNTAEVSKVLSYCYQRNLAICPQGGNTGLVGGSTPIYDEIVLSTSLMNKIMHFDDVAGVLTCQSGCVLESINDFVAKKNFIVPLDLGSKGSCQIGGNVSTNAGGLRLIRYGSLHANVLGIEAVLPNGRILNCMNAMRKDNTGYDIKHMFIGSEGTLGVITRVILLCHPKPSDTAVAFLGCNNFEQILGAVKVIKNQLPEVLSSLEMLDHQAAEVVKDNLKLTIPIQPHKFYILIEVSGSNSKYIEESLTNCLNSLMDKELVNDGTMVLTPTHVKAIWSIRERITEALLMEGCGYKYDISLPLKDFYTIVEILRERIGSRVTRCCAYGHLGDGNLHFNATTQKFDSDVLNAIEPFIYEWTSERGGSISAEHGIGYKKKNYLHFNKTPEAISIMRSLKQLLDPKNLLNPYKVL